MGIEIRNGRPRYVKKVWRDGRCISMQVASGEAAQLLAAMADRLRLMASERRQRAREECEILADHDREMDETCARADSIAHAALIAAGYHRHKRTWRMKRVPVKKKAKATTPVIPDRGEPGVPMTQAALMDLMDRAKYGDETTVPILREMLWGEYGREFVSLCGGNPAQLAERLLVTASSDRNVASREALKYQLASMRVELAGPAPTPMEALLVDRVILTWLDLHILDAKASRSDVLDATSDRRDRARDRASRRYLAAIKSLAMVRRLALPTIQMNVAEQQVVM